MVVLHMFIKLVQYLSISTDLLHFIKKLVHIIKQVLILTAVFQIVDISSLQELKTL